SDKRTVHSRIIGRTHHGRGRLGRVVAGDASESLKIRITLASKRILMPLTFHHNQLPNGLDIVAERNPDAHSVALGLFVKTGSRDEAMDVNGVSHFLEHMMFKGSSKYTWEDVNRIFDEIGAKYNAFTSQEMTAY